MTNRIQGLALVLACLSFTCCAALQNALSGLSKPTAEVQGVHLDSLSVDSAALGFDVKITNPYAVPLPLANIGYTLATNATPFLTGNAALQGTIPANGNKTITIPTTVHFAQLLHAASGVTPGSIVPYKATLTLSVNIPGGSTLALPLETEGKFPVPAVPQAEFVDFKTQTLTLEKASGVLHVKLTNTNQFPIDLSKLGVNLSVGGTALATVSSGANTHFDPGSAQTLEVAMDFSPLKLGLDAISILQNPSTKFSVDGGMDGQTPFGPLHLPFKTGTNK